MITIQLFQPCHQARCVELFCEGEVLQYSKDALIQQDAKKFIAWSIENDLSHIEEVYLTPHHGPSGNFWVAVDDSKCGYVCGMVGLERKTAFDGEVRRMFVDSQYQGQQIGSQLIETLKNYAAEQQFKSLYLTTPKGSRAVEFYLKHGFVPECELDAGENGSIRLVKLRYTLKESMFESLLMASQLQCN